MEICDETLTKKRRVSPSITEDPKCLQRCQYFLEKKKRTCKAYAAPGLDYCVEHSYLFTKDSDGKKKRIPCPLDPNHSCYEDNLEKHLRKCNKTKETKLECYCKKINAGEMTEDDESLNLLVTIRSVPDDEVLDMVNKCRTLHSEHIGDIVEEPLFHPTLKSAHDDPKNGSQARKHLVQQASLVAHMENMNLLQDSSTFIEFGAGKGALSHWVQKALGVTNDTQYLLVERSGYRYKLDCYHKGDQQGPNFERLKIDIEHLNLGKCTKLDHNRAVVGIGKHLCGGATDLMLRCLINTLTPKEDHKRWVQGVVLALCCHHRCDWRSYVGKDFMRSCGLNARQFMLLCSLSSWGTCSSAEVVDGSDYNHPRYGKLLPQEREVIGHMCKNLIDYGRAEFLKKHGFEVELKQYVGKDLTLENVCLLAKRTEECGDKTV